MKTLKDHQNDLVQILANGTAVPASTASTARLAHALHDVIAMMVQTHTIDALNMAAQKVTAPHDATTPGLNDAAIADPEPRQIIADLKRENAKMHNQVKQFRAVRMRDRDTIADLTRQLSASQPLRGSGDVVDGDMVDAHLSNALIALDIVTSVNAGPDVAGARKSILLAQALLTPCTHSSWEDVAHGDKRCCDCGLFIEIPSTAATKGDC